MKSIFAMIAVIFGMICGLIATERYAMGANDADTFVTIGIFYGMMVFGLVVLGHEAFTSNYKQNKYKINCN